MVRVAQRLAWLQAWRSRQAAPLRWALAAGLFAAALAVRLGVGPLHGANPALTFYPAILVAAVALGWQPAAAVLAAAVTVGGILFVPPGRQLQPVAWLLVGGLNIAIIASLQQLAQELAAANERHRVLFREVQHRVANTLQAVTGTFDRVQRRMDASPAEAAALLQAASARFAAAADVHRRLHDPALFQRGLDGVLPDAVATAVDRTTVQLHFDIAPLELSFDQMSTITMLVIEAANNAQKHVFRHGRGSRLEVSLRSVSRDQALLCIADDGAGDAAMADPAGASGGLGMGILEGLVRQIGGTLSVQSGRGTEIRVSFPVSRAQRAGVGQVAGAFRPRTP